jgi:hypothetical protein
MENGPKPAVTRKAIGIRLLYCVIFLIVFEIIKIIIQVTVLFQFVYLFITKEYNVPVRNFANKISFYGYRVIRYVTLNENQRPFPLSDFPAKVEPSDDQVIYT